MSPHVVQLVSVCQQSYRDGYEVSGSIQGLGAVYKAGAVLFLVGGVLAGVAAGGALSIVLIVGGIVLAVLFYTVGVVVRAVGQTMSALLDTAVNTRALLESAGPVGERQADSGVAATG